MHNDSCFNPTKAQFRELLLLRIDQMMAESADECDHRPDPVVYPSRTLYEQRTLWLDAVDERFASLPYETAAYEYRRRTLAVRLLNELRHGLCDKVLSVAQATWRPKPLRNLAWAVLKNRRPRAMAYLLLHLDELRRWMLDTREEREDQSALAVDQRRYNASRETWRDGSDEQVEVFTDGYVEVADDTPDPEGATLSTLRTHGKSCEVHGVRRLVQAGNAPTQDVDGRGFHRESQRPRKLKRWAFCQHCTAINQANNPDGDEVWFLTASKPGTARHSKKGCRRTEGTPPERKVSPLQWVIRNFTRRSTPVTQYQLLTKTRRGWMTTSIARYDHLGARIFHDRPMEVCSAVQSHAVTALRRRKAKEIQARRAAK